MSEISIWVDQFYGSVIGHGMFVRSLCPEKSPNRASGKLVRWNQPGTSYFDRDDLPLGYCKVNKYEAVFHLWDLGEAAWGAFHKDHGLNELDFQPKMAGMIIVIERESVLYAQEIESQKGSNSLLPSGTWYVSWLEEQALPYVIATSGYEGLQAKLEELRTVLELRSNVPMIPGPSLMQRDDLLFDSEHANQVLLALRNVLELEDH